MLMSFCVFSDYKKARAEIKKASSDTIRLQKKAKKGEFGCLLRGCPCFCSLEFLELFILFLSMWLCTFIVIFAFWFRSFTSKLEALLQGTRLCLTCFSVFSLCVKRSIFKQMKLYNFGSLNSYYIMVSSDGQPFFNIQFLFIHFLKWINKMNKSNSCFSLKYLYRYSYFVKSHWFTWFERSLEFSIIN